MQQNCLLFFHTFSGQQYITKITPTFQWAVIMNETENIKSYKLIQSRSKRIFNENSCSVMIDKNAAVIWSNFFNFFLFFKWGRIYI